MKINSRKKLLTSVAAVVLSAATIAAGTAFYMNAAAVDADSTNNGITLTLSESEGSPVEQGDGSIINIGYTIIPATSQKKDPTVTINTPSEAYLFVVVEDNTNSLVTYSLSSSGWTKIDNTNFSQGTLSDNQTVYYRIVPKNTNTTYHILDGDSVSYRSNIVNEDMLKENGELLDDLSLVFSAKAIETRIASAQSGTDVQKAAYAYEHFDDKEITEIIVNSRKNWITAISEANKSEAESVKISVQTNYSSTAIDLSNINRDLEIEGGNYSISSSSSGSQVNIAGGTARTVTINNFDINNGYYGDSKETILIKMNESSSELILNNVTMQRSSFWGLGIILWSNRYGLYAESGKTTITGSTSISMLKYSSTIETAIYVGNGATVIVDENMTGTISGIISVDSGGTLEIRGGTFKNTGLTINEFKKYVPSGYTVTTNNSDGSFTVQAQ